MINQKNHEFARKFVKWVQFLHIKNCYLLKVTNNYQYGKIRQIHSLGNFLKHRQTVVKLMPS